jgi:ribosomal protein S18 acetylase RimI-like enzyme
MDDINKVLDENGIDGAMIAGSVNQALYVLLKSPALKKMTEGMTLHQSSINPMMKWIEVSSLNDPLDKSPIRSSTRIDFQKDYLEPKGIAASVSDVAYKASEVMTVPEKDIFTDTIIEGLRQRDPVYGKILDNTFNHEHVEYALIPASNNSIEQLMSYGLDPTISYLKNVLQHGDLELAKNNAFIIAHTAAGPVGILALERGGYHGTSKDQMSVTALSIAPGFRGRGIADSLLTEGAKYAYNKKAFIVMPPENNKKKKDAYLDLITDANKNSYRVPFIEPGVSEITEMLTTSPIWGKLTQDQQYHALGQIVSAIKDYMGNGYDMSSRIATKDIAGISAVMEKVVPHVLKETIEDPSLQNKGIKHSYSNPNPHKYRNNKQYFKDDD